MDEGPRFKPHGVRLSEVTTEAVAWLWSQLAYLDASVHPHNDQSVRRALHPLSILAERTGTAILVVRHLNKQPGRNVIYRGGGSIGIIGAVRSGLIVCKDPDFPQQRLLGVSKSNLCKPPRSIRYELSEGTPAHRVVWLDACDADMDDVFSAQAEASPGAGAEAEDFLRKRLAAGEAPVTEIIAEATQLGSGERTLRRAKAKLGIDTRRQAISGPLVLVLPCGVRKQGCKVAMQKIGCLAALPRAATGPRRDRAGFVYNSNQRRARMLKAVLKKGVITPLEPVPPEWEEGASLEVAKAGDAPVDIDGWAASMNELCADSATEEEDAMRRAIEEHRQQAKSQTRREMGLPA